MRNKKLSENSIELLENNSKEARKIAEFLGAFASAAFSTYNPTTILSFFTENAFGATAGNDAFIITEEGIEKFINTTALVPRGFRLTSKIDRFIAKPLSVGLYETAFQLNLYSADRNELVEVFNVALTLTEYGNTFKICNMYAAVNEKNEVSEFNEKEISKLADMIKQLANKIPIGIIRTAKDATFAISYANSAFYSLLGYTPTEFEAAHGNSFLTCIHPDDVAYAKDCLTDGLSRNVDLHFDMRFVAKNKDVKFVEVIANLSEQTDEKSMTIVFHDTTKDKRELLAVKRAADQLNRTGNNSETDCMFEFYPNRNMLTFSTQAVEKYGLPNIMENVYAEISRTPSIHPDYADSFIKMLSHINGGEHEASSLIKLKCGDNFTFVSAKLKAVYNENGVMVKALGMLSLANVQEDLELLFKTEAASKQMLLTDGESLNIFYLLSGNYEYSSYKGDEAALSKLMQGATTFYQQLTVYAATFVAEKDRNNFLTLLSKNNLIRLYEQGICDFHFEHLEKPLNSEKYVNMDVIVHIEKSEHTSKVQAYVYVKNVDKVKTLEDYFRFKAEHDELTKLYNRATATTLITKAIKAGGGNQLHALATIDISNFVSVNDTFGQDYGDALLTEFAKKLPSIFDETAIIARSSGHQFIVFMRDIPSKEYAMARLQLVCDYYSASHQQETGTTINIGVAFDPFDAKTFIDLMQASEKALTESKNTDKAACNLLKYEDITKTKYENDVKRRSDIAVGSDVMSDSNKKSKRGAYQYFVDKNVKYWTVTVLFTIIVVAIIVALEMTFSNVLSNFIVENDNAFWFIIFCAAAVLIAIAILYATSNKKINNILYVDKITLGNSRLLFEEAVETYTMKHNVNYAFVYSDILDFRIVNERFGNKAGDSVLKKYAAIISNCLGEKEISGRLYDDKFGMLVRFEKDRSEVFEKLERIERLARRIGDEKGEPYDVRVKFGVYFVDPSAKEDITLFETHAELALNKALENQQLIYYVFDERTKNIMLREKELEGMMQDSLFNNNFVVYIQPKISTVNGQVVGGEALVRWLHEGEFIMPSEFISLFEKNGFITKLDEYIFTEICKTLRRWQDEGRRLIVISVNITKKSFQQPNFVRIYKRIMDKYRIDKRFIEFEITESMMVDDFERFTQIIAKIHGMGCTCSIDDFGTGFSSLSLLKNASVDALKVDRSFFLVGPSQEETMRAKAVIKGIVDIAKSLNMVVVAEGVEIPSLIQYLRDIYCDEIQSFAFYRPLAIEDFQKLLK